MDPTKKTALRAIKILRNEIQVSDLIERPAKRIEMNRQTFDTIREATKTDLFDLAEDKIDGDLGSLNGVPIKENSAVPDGKARMF